MAPRVGARGAGEHVGDEGEGGGVIGGSVCDPDFAQFGAHLLGIVGRPRHDRLGGVRHDDDGITVAVLAGADEVFGLCDRALEAGAPLDPSGHAERGVDDDDVVRAGHVGDGLGGPGFDVLPEIFGPPGGGDHGEEDQREGQRPQREEEPLIDSALVSPFGDEEEPDGGPGDDLVALAEEEVDDERNADGGDGGSGGESGAEHGERGVHHVVRRATAGTDRERNVAPREPGVFGGVLSMTGRPGGGNRLAVGIDSGVRVATMTQRQK